MTESTILKVTGGMGKIKRGDWITTPPPELAEVCAVDERKPLRRVVASKEPLILPVPAIARGKRSVERK